MNSLGNLGQVVTPALVVRLLLWTGEAGRPSYKLGFYYYAGMFLVASVCWLFVDPRRVIVYGPQREAVPA